MSFFAPGTRFFRSLHLGPKSWVLASLSVLSASSSTLAFVNVGDVKLTFLAATLTSICLYAWRAFFLSIHTDVRQLQLDLQQIQTGDLRTRPKSSGQDELSELATRLGSVTLTLSAVSADIRSNAALVSHVGQQLNIGSKDLSTRTEQQAASLEETSACLEEISSVVQLNAENANHATAISTTILDQASRGVESMRMAVVSVQKIKEHSLQMQNMVDVIDRLAAQTTILALNASIEAARAGEQGRGFAVVASEVRTLAQRSAESAQAVRQLIAQSSNGVEVSMGLIHQTSDLLRDMNDDIQKMAINNSEISKSSNEQSTGLNEVSIAVQQMDQITQRNAQMVEQTVSDAAKLGIHADDLMNAVAKFKLQQGTADEAVLLVGQAIAAQRNTQSKSTFFSMLSDPHQPFHDRDMYVFVLDHAGHYLAFGGQPSKVGTRVQDIPGIRGQQLVDDIIVQANKRPGWVEYDINNPATGTVQTKMSFVQQLDDFYIGCGVYKSLVS